MSRRSCKYLACAITVIPLSALAWHFRAPLLEKIANAWIVPDPLSYSYAIVVVGGGIQTRPFEAARLYRDGYAPRVLVASPERKPTDQMGLTAGDADVTKQILLKQGVPDSAIVIFGEEVSSTYEEALALREWVKETGAKKIIIVSDPFHTRRMRWLLRKELTTTGAQILTGIAAPLKYTVSNWWQTKQGLVKFQKELMKYAYYRVRY
jgi:uncharacterized SAM-binding protein YcdF (DUF218 family)